MWGFWVVVGGGGARRWRAEIGWLSVEEYVDPEAADVNVLFTGMFYRGPTFGDISMQTDSAGV